MKRFSAALLCLLTSGCVAVGGDPLTMTFNSDVSAGVVYQNGENLGTLPVKIQYDVANTPFDEHGCFLVPGVDVVWQSGYMTSTPALISLCFGIRHYDYHIPYNNPDDLARAEDRRFAYHRANALPGSAAGAIPHWAQPAPSENPSALENLLGALNLGSALYEVQQEMYSATSDDPFERQRSRVSIGGTCRSDRDCSYGQRCTKPIYSTTGFCVKPMSEEEVRGFFQPEYDNVEID